MPFPLYDGAAGADEKIEIATALGLQDIGYSHHALTAAFEELFG